MAIVAHIAGVPVEETALSLAPVATVLGGVAVAQLRRVRRRIPSSTALRHMTGRSNREGEG